MKIWLIYVWDGLRERLWFLPSVYSLAALVAAFALLHVDRSLSFGTESLLPSLRTTGVAARTALGALIGALVTVVGLVFSLTMLSVAQTATQYGPRLIRNVFDRNVTQNTLGLFLGTIVFSIIVLRSIREVESGERVFIPNLSILVAEVAAAGCVFSLLIFTSHMASCMRAETLVESIYEDLKATANKIYPRESADYHQELDAELQSVEAWRDISDAVPLHSHHAGYLQAVNLHNLMHWAEMHGHRIQIDKRPGHFIHKGALLATIELGPQGPTVQQKKLIEKYRSSFLIGLVRTPRQDVEAGVMELVEAAVRALSPGVNDPNTAINVVDYLSSLLAELAQREWPRPVLLDHQHTPRIRTPIASFDGILNTGFDQLRQFAASSVAVQCRLLEGLDVIAAAAHRTADKLAVKRQADMILRQAEREIPEPHDLDDVRQRYAQVVAHCEEA